MSVNIFFSYADLGFLGAGQKYAAEAYACNDRTREITLIGFSHFIFLCLAVILGFVFLYLSFHPELLIRGLTPGSDSIIAQRLLLTLAAFVPVAVIQRVLQMIFSVRLQEYKLQKLVICGNVIKISSAFFFFGSGRYDIVGYFLFMQMIALGVALTGLYFVRIEFKYDLKKLLSSLRFNRSLFTQTKGLAFSSVFVTFTWILYYELDPFVIGKLLGAQQVAIFAIGLSLLTFFRSILGIVFAPFISRFNHFIGQNDIIGLRKFYLTVLTLTFPIVVLPIVVVSILLHPIVISWVGPEYEASVDVARWLILCNILAFVSYPTGILLTALKKLKSLYWVNGLMPILYWGGIWISLPYWGLESFGIFKFVTFVFCGVMYIVLALQFLKISLTDYLRHYIVPYLPALTIVGIGLFILPAFWETAEKSKLHLLFAGLQTAGAIVVGFLLSYLTVRPIRSYVHRLRSTLKPN